MSTIASHSSLNFSEIVRDRGLVPRTVSIAYEESNCHATNDVRWPWSVKSWSQ